MAKKEKKTNAMRMLEAAGAEYISHTYEQTPEMTGEEIAKANGQDPDCVFKTLVTVAKSGEHFVFVIPVSHELDLKKAAKAVGEKAVSMIKAKELLPLTGYVHGGCSPVGMKKQFVTVFDESLNEKDHICFSGGRLGLQVEIAVSEIAKAVDYTTADLKVI